jgi:hypothetical protein
MHQPIDDSSPLEGIDLKRVRFFFTSQVLCDHYPQVLEVGYPADDGTEVIYEFTCSGIFPPLLQGVSPDFELLEELLPVTLSSAFIARVWKGGDKKIDKELITALKVVEEYRNIKLREIDPQIQKLNSVLERKYCP